MPIQSSALSPYLKNRVFLSRNYRLIVAPRKFDVLKTNICPRSEALRANMLGLRTSNFQGATIRPVVSRQTLYCLYCSQLNFLPGASSKINWISFNFFRWKPWKPNVKFQKENRQNSLNTISIVCFLQTRLFTETFSRTGTIHPGICLSADEHYCVTWAI